MTFNIKFAPLINKILVFLQKHDWRGKYKFYLWLSNKYPHKVIEHKINSRYFVVPVGEWCFWLEKGPENYYLDEFLPFCNFLNELERPFTLFDLGADIGTVSSLISVNCANLRNVIAFEPNPKSFNLLKTNLDCLPNDTRCYNAAISDFNGYTRFHADNERLNDHEGYIESNAYSTNDLKEGATEVTSLDHWLSKGKKVSIENVIALKIDVEGQEIPLLNGAEILVKSAEKVIILIEVHPGVLARTNNTPEDLFIAAEQYRSFKWIVPLKNNLSINRNHELFDQVPQGQYDVIGISD